MKYLKRALVVFAAQPRSSSLRLMRLISQAASESLLAHSKAMAPCLIAAVIFAAMAVPRANSQTDEPRTIEVDVPFEMMAPWYTPDNTAIEDEVLLRGTLKVTTRTWAPNPGHIDRFSLHANAVDIHGTSETTGQRFRLNGSFSYDLIDPDVTFNPDGSFNVPMQDGRLRLHKVDPGPAALTANLDLSSGATPTSPWVASPITIPCERLSAPDGSPTASLNCGSVILTWWLLLPPTITRVVVAEGDACVPGTTCIVPDGATLFNGYTGGYKPPLFGIAQAYTANFVGLPPGSLSLRWRCKTGNREVAVTPLAGNGSGGVFVGECRPIYSSTEPITMWVDLSYRFIRQLTVNSSQEVTILVSERPYTFYMDERPMDQSPVISTFSVSAVSRINGRCAIGQVCELIDGDVIYNTQLGDYERDLFLNVTATDPEGDPIFVEWFCQSGSYFAPITNQSGGLARCTAGYIWPDAISVYARVSDGNNAVWTQQRLLYMLEFLQ